jgi:hypothetical protein
MGLQILLKNEKGEILDSVIDFKKLLNKLLPNFDNGKYSCLRFIDRYGDTVFNRLQMSVFLDEWNWIVEKATSEEEKNLVLHIKDLATRCQKEPHLYLMFFGD